LRNKTHNGNVRITADNQDKMLKLLARTTHIGGDLSIDSNVHADLPALTSLGGYLFIHSNVHADLPALTSLGGYLSIHSNVGEKLAKYLLQTYAKNRSWVLGEGADEILLTSTIQDIEYKISDVAMDKATFDAIRHGTMTASDVFAIENTEIRRVAYERLDKSKMSELKPRVLQEGVESNGKPIKLVEIILPSHDKSFRYLVVIDPSTDREYWLDASSATRATLNGIKLELWGLPDNLEWTRMW